MLKVSYKSDRTLPQERVATKPLEDSLICRVFKIIFSFLTSPFRFLMPKAPSLKIEKSLPPQNLYLEKMSKCIQHPYSKIALIVLGCAGMGYLAMHKVNEPVIEPVPTNFLLQALVGLGVVTLMGGGAGIYAHRQQQVSTAKITLTKWQEYSKELTQVAYSIERIVKLFPEEFDLEKKESEIKKLEFQEESVGYGCAKVLNKFPELLREQKGDSPEIQNFKKCAETTIRQIESTLYKYPLNNHPFDRTLDELSHTRFQNLIDLRNKLNQELIAEAFDDQGRFPEKKEAFKKEINETLKTFKRSDLQLTKEEIGEKKLAYFQTELREFQEDWTPSLVLLLAELKRIEAYFEYVNGFSFPEFSNIQGFYCDVLAMLFVAYKE